MYEYLFIVFISSAFVNSEAARILAVIPTPSVSHQVVFRPLTQELAKRGHDVVVITTDPAFPKGQTPDNLTEIDMHDLSYKTWQEHIVKAATGNKNSILTQMKTIFDTINVIFEKQLQTNEFQEIIRNKSFDLLLLEACVRPALVLSHIFKSPVIQISSFGRFLLNYEVIGAPTHPLLYPPFWIQRINNLTQWEKIVEVYNHNKMLDMFYTHEDMENEMIRRVFGVGIPTLSELSNNVDMMFFNTHYIWEGNHPVPPGVVYIWGIHQNPVKDLPKDLQSYLDSSVNGAIYMSFGTNTNTSLLPPQKIQMFLKVFSQLPYNILWKWDNDDFFGQMKNVRISKWFPQSDLLRHPNIKLFITQGGLQSTEEAIQAEVPLIGIPMLADQWYNVEKYIYHKIGLKLDIETVTDEEFRNAIENVIGDDSYRRAVSRLRSLLLDQPAPPLARAVWWAEHVLRHGGATHLRAPAANITWREYIELDLVIILVLFLFVISFITIIALYLIIKFCYRNLLSVKIKNE